MGRWKKHRSRHHHDRRQGNRSDEELSNNESNNSSSSLYTNGDVPHTTSSPSHEYPFSSPEHTSTPYKDSPTSCGSNSTIPTSNYAKKSLALPDVNENDTTFRAKLNYAQSQNRPNRAFTSIEKETIHAYLMEYYNRATKGGLSMKADQEEQKSEDGIRIGGHKFPMLTPSVVNQPYLALPETLTGKQRRALHDVCLEIGLYHESSGGRDPADGKSYNQRRMVVSMHEDGFLGISPPLSPPTRIPIKDCRPWYYTPIKSDDVGQPQIEKLTREARLNIQCLVEDPGRCLRDAHDVIDYAELIDLDLSSLAIPAEDDYEGPMGFSEETSNRDNCPWMLVDTPEKMDMCVQEIVDSHPSEIGFDMEMYNQNKYTGITCLIQLATEQKSYIIDPFAPSVWSKIGPCLSPIFSDPSIVKIGHCIGSMDVPALHRDFGIVVINAFDTYEAAKIAKIPKLGLAALCEYYHLNDNGDYAKLKEFYQRCEWRKRPLSRPMLRYGRFDAWFLILLRKLLIRDLTRGQFWDVDESFGSVVTEKEKRLVSKALAATLKEKTSGNGTDDAASVASSGFTSNASDDEGYFTPVEDELTDTEYASDDDSLGKSQMRRKRSTFVARELRTHLILRKVIAISQKRCLALWTNKNENPMRCDAIKTILRREGPRWSTHQTKLFKKLFAWRQTISMELGTLPGFICTTEFLVSVAYKRPVNESMMRRISYFFSELLEDKHTGCMNQILDIVKVFAGNDEGEVLKALVVDGRNLKSDFAEESVSSGSEKSQTRSVIMAPEMKVLKKKKDRFSFAIKISGVVAVGALAAMIVRRKNR